MKKILPFALLILVYICLRLLLPKITPKTDTAQTVDPFVVLSVCEESDQAISVTDKGLTVCKNDTYLYIFQQGKKQKVVDIPKNTHYFLSSSGYLISQTAQTVSIKRFQLPISVEPLYAFDLPSSATLISTFLVQTIGNADLIYVSTQKEAKKVTDIKSIIYRIELPINKGEASNPTISTYESQEMLRVVDVYHKGKLYTSENFFLFSCQNTAFYFGM